MSRKSIFDLLQNEFDFAAEIDRIETLFSDHILIDGLVTRYTAEKYVEANCFYSWKHRNRCVDCEDMRGTLHIDKILESNRPTIEQVLIYIEYVENILALCDLALSETGAQYYMERDLLEENIRSLLDQINYESKYFKEKQMVLVVEKNEAATAAAELMDDETALSIIRYNHYVLKGNLKEKRKILISLADSIEPLRKELKSINSSLESDVGFLLNNLHIRHNNKDRKGKNYNKIVDNMGSEEFENWYDETYQVVLLCLLEHDHLKRSKQIRELKSMMGI